MELHYHDRVITLAEIEARPANAGSSLDSLEKTHGVVLPPSVRDWYSIAGAVDLLRQFSNDDQPIAVEQLGAHDHGRIEHRAANGVALLPFMIENQGVCTWAWLLDGSEDPPVHVRGSRHAENEWVLCAESFSDFVLAGCWDHCRHLGRCELVAQAAPISGTELECLERMFQHGPTTYAFPGNLNWRFTDSIAYLSLWHDEEGQSDWTLRAPSVDDLYAMAKRVWTLSDLRRSLWAPDESAKQVLIRLRAEE